MGRLLDSPWPIVVIVIVTLLLFSAPKLPAMATSGPPVACALQLLTAGTVRSVRLQKY